MESTTSGMNLTGVAAKPEGAQAMREAVQRFSPPAAIDTSAAEHERLLYLQQSDAIGTVPRPVSVASSLKTGIAQLLGKRPELLLDKVGERIAFERGGVRLYDALMVKHQAAATAGAATAAAATAAAVLPPIALALEALSQEPSWLQAWRDEQPAQTLARIRAEELAHFHLLCEAMRQLGGDPSAQTPCADVIGTASLGLVQVVSDPRTTLAQSLNAMLMAELTDNAGWELLLQLSDSLGEAELSARFKDVLAEEEQHLHVIRSWLEALLMREDPSTAV